MEKRELIRKEILYYIEKNSRANLGELAVLLGTDEVTVANEIAEMEKDKVICGYDLFEGCLGQFYRAVCELLQQFLYCIGVGWDKVF